MANVPQGLSVSANSSWIKQDSNYSGFIIDVEYGNGIWIASADNGFILISSDGLEWTPKKISDKAIDFISIVYADDKWYLIGNETFTENGATKKEGRVFSSSDGEEWFPVNYGGTSLLRYIDYGNGIVIVTETNGNGYYSYDGASWKNTSIGSDLPKYRNNGFISMKKVSTSSSVNLSPDGINWTPHDKRDGNNNILSFATYQHTYGMGMYVSVGRGIYTSPDGITWTKQSIPISDSDVLSDVEYYEQKFWAVGLNGNILSSVDGVTWEKETSGTTSYLREMFIHQGQMVIVGHDGTILTKGIENNQSLLSELSISNGTLSPEFSPEITDYTSSVGSDVSNITVTPTLANSSDGLMVNGTVQVSGSSIDVPLNFGINMITIEVAGIGNTKTYNIAVTRESPTISGNADLSSLTIDSGTLTPVFSSSVTSYTATVSHEVENVDVTPTVADPKAKVRVLGQLVESGSANPIELSEGINVVGIEVTAEDGTPKTYTINVFRESPPLSNNANLSSLILDNGSLSPEFSPGITNYSVDVENQISSINITPTAEDNTASIKIKGLDVESGETLPVPLQVGLNVVDIVVKAQDETQKVYFIEVNRALSDNAKLTNLTLNHGSLTPEFDPSVTEYEVSVGNDVKNIILSPSLEDSTASFTINGLTPGSAVPLQVGENVIEVTVTAQNGTTKVYTVKVARVPSNIADLTSINLSEGELSPSFNSLITEYTVDVKNDIKELQVEAIPKEQNATVRVNGRNPSESIPLQIGENTILIEVTAQDQVSTKTYSLTVTRKQSSNTNLSSLTISKGVLSPAFDSNITNYSANVENSVDRIDVNALTVDSAATIVINGNPSPSGQEVFLQEGNNEITIDVTAQDGTTTKRYTLQIVRAVSVTGTVKNVTPFGFDIIFEPAVVGISKEDISIVDATVTAVTDISNEAINGIPVMGKTYHVETILIPDRSYQLDVTKENYEISMSNQIEVLNNRAELTDIKLSEGQFIFDPATLEYDLTFPNDITTLKVTPIIASETNATLTINGLDPLEPVTLNVGVNPILIKVTAEDRVTTKTYTLNVTREKSKDANLDSISLDNGTLTPAFDRGVEKYNVRVGYSVTSIQVIPRTAHPNASLSLNGNSYTQTVPLMIGVNTVPIVVTAEDGITKKTYTLTIIRSALSSPPSTPPTNTRESDVTVGQDGSVAVKIEIIRKQEMGKKVDEVNMDQNKAREVVQKAVQQKKDVTVIHVTDLPQDNADQMLININRRAMDELSPYDISLQVKTPSVAVSLPKDTVHKVDRKDIDLSFRVTPLRTEESKEEILDNMKKSEVIKKEFGNRVSGLKVFGTPVDIESNYSGLQTDVLIPLDGLSLPTKKDARDKYLKSLRVFVKHSDGTEELLVGDVLTHSDGQSQSLKVSVRSFSTFVLIDYRNTAPVIKSLSLKGSQKVDSTLQAVYSYHDAEGDKLSRSFIRWYRVDADNTRHRITGAFKNTYKLTEQDIGCRIMVDIIPIARTGLKFGKKSSTLTGEIKQ